MARLNFPEKIETERLWLRRLRYEDAEEIFYTYASKPEATRFMAWPTHQRLEDTRSFLQYAVHSWNEGTDYSFSIRLKDNEKMIGSIGVMHDQGKIQFGYILSPSVWGSGYATEACTRTMELLRTFPSLFRIGTFVDVDNTASIKVLRKSGLVEEARLEKWFRFVNQENQPKDCLLFKLPLS